METINKAAHTVTRTIWGSKEDTDTQSQQQQTEHRPTEHQLREGDEYTATEGNTLPTSGPGRSTYENKPIVTTTSETSTLTDDQSSFENLSTQSKGAESGTVDKSTEAMGVPQLKDTAATRHRRVDSGHAELEYRHDQGTPFQRFGVESSSDNGVHRTAAEIDQRSHTIEGNPRPLYHGDETSDDGIRRAGGRDRVQFDDARGSSGSLRPGETGEGERERGGSDQQKHQDKKMGYMEFGPGGGIPTGARIGTVQGGSAWGDKRQQDLGDAQTAHRDSKPSTLPHHDASSSHAETSNAITPESTHASHGPVEPSVSANPAHAQQDTLKHRGSDRPVEKPKDELKGVAKKEGKGEEEKEEKQDEPGHLYVKSTGVAAEGGDFDAAKPGAGREADRLYVALSFPFPLPIIQVFTLNSESGWCEQESTTLSQTHTPIKGIINPLPPTATTPPHLHLLPLNIQGCLDYTIRNMLILRRVSLCLQPVVAQREVRQYGIRAWGRH